MKALLSRLAIGMVLAALASLPATAGWLSRIGHGAAEVGEAGAHASKLGKLGLGALDHAAAYVAKLPVLPKGAALAAHATPEGHWKFVNREGEVFTAGTADELARATAVLAPDAAGGKLALYLSEDTIFGQRALLKDLPPEAELHLVTGKDSYRIRRGASAASGSLSAEVRPNITVDLADRKLFSEASFQLARPLNRSNIRVLALEPGGPRALSSVPRFDPATKAALVDQIDPGALEAAFAKLRGQTVLISGRVDGDALAFLPASGAEQKLLVRNLVAAAEASDVNLVLLNAAAARQPGGRNWLWQKVEVAGLDEALRRATFADFLASLAQGGELAISAAEASYGRITLRAVPSGEQLVPLSGTIQDLMAEVTGQVTGQVITKSVEVYARDKDREQELDSRLLPGIPSALQFAYLGATVAGLMSLAVSRPWWRRVWPPEAREEYSGATGYYAARAARFLAFLLLFLPLAGLPAFLWSMALQLWGMLTSPFRAFSWLRARITGARG